VQGVYMQIMSMASVVTLRFGLCKKLGLFITTRG
jgi:hypothetical protein